MLHMTATPIPRTLYLANFGALDVTTLRELPKGRQPIVTHLVSGERERDRAYERIREELRAGRQAFVVCPLVSESEALQARAATAEFERLQETDLADFRLVLLHGQMRPREKAAAMEQFAAGNADVLVATTVIEVGIDVPNATVMLVRTPSAMGSLSCTSCAGASGAARTRRCACSSGPRTRRACRRWRHTDGFELAAIDLALRGEGELTGTRQSGLARFRARLPEDAAILERAHARAAVREDPGLQAPELSLLAADSRRPRRSPWRRGRGRSPRRPAAAAPRGRTRPTSDRVREHCSRCSGRSRAPASDLFAGSRRWPSRRSRGASSAVIERDGRAVEVIRANLKTLGLGEDGRAWSTGRPRGLRDASARGDAYDLVLLDPPYRDAPALGRELSEALPASGARGPCRDRERPPLATRSRSARRPRAPLRRH
jgi:hypothetical protein